MPNAANKQNHGQLLGLMGQAGTGKSLFAVQSPQPHAVLCVDKPVLVDLLDTEGKPVLPSYDPALTFGKFYPPPAKDLTNEKEKPSRNVFDEIIRDIEVLKRALYKGDKTFKMGEEEWVLPKTIIIEGVDFIRDHCVNWVLNTQDHFHMDEFETATGKSNPFLGWGLVASHMEELFFNLTFLPAIRPVNVIVTIGLDNEKKRTVVNGRTELIETGNFDPAFGGKMGLEAPRKFRDFWLTERIGGKYFVNTASTDRTAKYRGLRSGRLGLKATEDVTIDLAKPVSHWDRLFREGA